MRYRNTLVLILFVMSTLSVSADTPYGGSTTTSTVTTDTSFTPLYNNTILDNPVYGKIGVIYAEIRDGKTYVQINSQSGAAMSTSTIALNGASQVPSVSTNALWTGVFVLDTINNTLWYNMTYTGLSSGETWAHFHGPAKIGTNTGVLFALPSGSSKVGVWNYNQNQESDILAGRIYVNIHSTNHPDGEIRGQIVFGTNSFTLDTTSIQTILTGIADKLGTNASLIQPFVLFRFVSLPSFTDLRESLKQALINKRTDLRTAYRGTFDSIRQRLNSVASGQKIPVFTRLILQIDNKIAQIKSSSTSVDSKQRLILLYGDLRLLVQQALSDIWTTANPRMTEDQILNDATDVR